jgi:hypothetical protein
MYKLSKLEQKLFNHIRKDHQGFVRPDCKVCRELQIKIEKDSKVNA